jgi:hypothetical protein
MKKKFKILAITFFILNYFIGNVFAANMCKDFIKSLKDNPEEFKVNYLPSAKFTYIDPGFDFKVFWDTKIEKGSKWRMKYTDEGNLVVQKFLHSGRNKEIKKGFELISIDGIPVKSKELYLYELYNYYDKAYEEDRELEFKFKDLNNKILTIKTKLFKYKPAQGTSNLQLKSINYIDQINGKFEVFLENNLTYSYKRKDGLHRAGLKYLQRKNDKGELEVQSCSFSPEEWKSTDSSLPSQHYKFENLRKVDQDQIETIIKVRHYSKEYGDSKDSTSITSSQEGNFIFSNDFNLRSFPFDRQTLKITLYDEFYKLDSRLLFSGSRTMRDLNYFVKNKKINGWDVLGAKSIDSVYQDPNRPNEGSAITLEIYIERKHGYYLFKVIFPIILILMVCWSVVWVDPKELESRLTITIVCLLSLIAYNFVIDSELPKLEYLTVLDWIVLISYIYATIPNFLSIISFRLQKTNLKLSNKLEVISKRYGLSSYILSIFLIVLLNANLNPENSSSLISWMAGR